MSNIYLISDSAKLCKKGDTLRLESPNGDTQTIFPYKTELLTIMGKVHITASAFRLMTLHKINTVFLTKHGSFTGRLVFQGKKNVFLRQKQFKLLDDPEFCLKTAKTLVRGKLKN